MNDIQSLAYNLKSYFAYNPFANFDTVVSISCSHLLEPEEKMWMLLLAKREVSMIIQSNQDMYPPYQQFAGAIDTYLTKLPVRLPNQNEQDAYFNRNGEDEVECRFY